LANDAYLMPSASRPGAYHRCWREGGVWLCSCEAGEQGLFHRHTALISAIEVALDQIEQGLVGEQEPEPEEEDDTSDIEVQYDDVPYPQGIGCVPPEQPADDYEDVGPVEPPAARLDDPERVASLVARLRAAKQSEIAPAPERPHWYGPAREQQQRESYARAKDAALALQERAARRRAREAA
jgi:hypothetical protein